MTEFLPRTSLEATLAELTERTLSRGERGFHIGLTLFAAGMGAVLIGLLATEPGVPLRTTIAIWVLVAIAAAWVAYGLRVLSKRRPLLANREIVAGRMSLLFSAVFTIGTMMVGLVNAGIAFTPATTLGGTMVLVALANLVRAHHRRASLRALRERLERELAAQNER